MQTASTHAGSRVILGCFRVGDVHVALDVAQVREVVRWQPVTPLPRAPALIEGVVDLRGVVVPVVDLGRVLSGRPVEPGDTARIALVEVGGLAMGLLCDDAIEVITADGAALEDPPALATQAGYEAARAVLVRERAAPIVVLSLEHVLEQVYRSALPCGEASP
jgi:purine-binding chemotaxis protein CheW